jgi:hypothetical protein
MVSKTALDERRIRLARLFRKQQSFAADTSPLAACLCGIVADWLDWPSEDDEPATWLIEASRDCSSFAVPMLLMAGLHREILGGQSVMRPLAEFFPSVGGRRPVSATAIRPRLREAIVAHRQQLARFIQSATVQTNETARGLCWLLPIFYPGWSAIHLVDLGCSAGLNLVADQRHYRLQAENAPQPDLNIGQGRPTQFILPWSGAFARPSRTAIPWILSRTGCDLHPFLLHTAHDELTLMSFVWGDQAHRLAMLRQGIAALKEVETSDAPVRLLKANLPHDLPCFLARHMHVFGMTPVVVYNTYLTPYLENKGTALGQDLEQWARARNHPVLWLQWEPPHQGPKPSTLGWLGWTADLWSNGQHHHWLLAWVHPHGTAVQWLPGLGEWADFWKGQTG